MSNNNQTQTYSKLLGWEIWNFMSIEHAEITFDERNIVNLKGYNDSGKSAALLALKVLFLNVNPTKQKDFIQDGKDFFKVVARFDDGVSIVRDKYTNGQSLYEMYKGKDLIYTTASADGILTKIQEVPEPIAQYLGLILYEDTCLNARSCIEQLIGVATKGADNYKLLNTVLKSEELAIATTQINKDKNEKDKTIKGLLSDKKATEDLYNSLGNITKELIIYLKNKDNELSTIEQQYTALFNISNILNEINNIKIKPEIATINNDKLKTLISILKIKENISEINTLPYLDTITTDKLRALKNILDISNSINNIEIAPNIAEINEDKLSSLLDIQTILKKLDIEKNKEKELSKNIKALDKEIDAKIKELGDTNLVKCPTCGTVFDPTNAEILPHKH